DVAFGGNFVAVVNTRHLGKKILPSNVAEFVELGNSIQKFLNRNFNFEHPINVKVSGVKVVLFYGSPESPDANVRSLAVFDQSFDRSPCGTGLSALLAV